MQQQTEYMCKQPLSNYQYLIRSFQQTQGQMIVKTLDLKLSFAKHALVHWPETSHPLLVEKYSQVSLTFDIFHNLSPKFALYIPL